MPVPVKHPKSGLKAALYARYSSDNQQEASIEDQFRICEEQAAREGWRIIERYADYATSGASLLRPGIQALLEDARAGRFNVIVAEALDRLSRDQEDIAGLYKRMEFAGIKIITLSEGEVSNLHIGLKGTMNALYLKDLAEKTRRGLRGRVEKGKSGGGKCYGYDVVKAFDADGNLVRGDRTINKAQAAIVKRIMTEFVAGRSPLKIAAQLNKEGVASPTDKGWGQSSINGNAERGTGILNNELYTGRLVWNRLTYRKDPDTGKRISKLNPPEEHIIHEVPHLRLIDDSLWQQVKARQQEIKRTGPTNAKNKHSKKSGFRSYRRPRFLLSGLVKCGVCSGTYTVQSKNYFGCSTRRNKGTCNNSLHLRHDRLEATVLGGLKHHLIQPESFDAFSKAFTDEVNRKREAQLNGVTQQKAELYRIEREIAKLITALKEGGPAKPIVAEINELEQRQEAIEDSLKHAKTPPPLLHPNMTKLYAAKLKDLQKNLNSDDGREEAALILRSLIDHVAVMPIRNEETGKLDPCLQVSGDLAGLLSFTASNEESLILQEDKALQLELVAGVGFEPMTFRL
ncbi:recombinase family protein [Paremcibacter congregatus]|uniref:recombinase family protein n=1 Tax=Paremcibacter congregatus TaxID=2043170 RepID=UPI003A94AE68